MSENRNLPPALLLHIAQTLNVPLKGLVAVIELLDDGGTVPFIARYRKEATGNLDEVQIRDIEDKLAYYRELEDRRETILASIAEQGKLTDELKAKIEAALDKSELEDLYLPYKPKRRTKATIAREKGLEPLATYIYGQQPSELVGPLTLSEYAATFINAELGVASIDEALEGARHIISEWISENAEVRKALRQFLFDEGTVISRRATDAKGNEAHDEQDKFKMYYDYKEPVKTIPSHRMLAIRRGEAEKVLYFLIEIETERAIYKINAHTLLEIPAPRLKSELAPQLALAIEDSWQRLLNSSIQAEIRMELKLRSDLEAIQVFKDNLYNLLLAAPAGPIAVLGIDPGLRTGCKVAVVDETGKMLDHDVIYPHTGKAQISEAHQKLQKLLLVHQVRAIAIGNGTAGRETDSFVREFLKEKDLADIFTVTVSESGASVYSASDIARQEFPDLDLTVRGAISIARRLQDPLSELVKVDPKSIGVGQYQHDVDQRKLADSLSNVIESCVNRVGVDLNTASWTLLRYVAGISERSAINIVTYRNEHGRFRSRTQVLEVAGIGPKTFEQCAGFLRIRGGDNPLDSTAVHPESYKIVEQIASLISSPVEEIIKQPQLLTDNLAKLDKSKLEVGSFTLADILEELKKPGRDPRDKFVAPSFSETVREITDVEPDMVLEGVVTNVTKFGAFVDIGVHQDGLVHISELSNKFIKEPSEAVKTGQIVKVKVLTVDARTKRIALSIKALLAPEPGQRSVPGASGQRNQSAPNGPRNNSSQRSPGGNSNRPAPPPAQTMEQKLAALNSKWKTR